MAARRGGKKRKRRKRRSGVGVVGACMRRRRALRTADFPPTRANPRPGPARGARQRADFARVRRNRYGKPRDHRIGGPSTVRDPSGSRRGRGDLRFSRLPPGKPGRGGRSFRRRFWGAAGRRTRLFWGHKKRKGGSNAGEKSSQKLKRGLKNKLQRAGKSTRCLMALAGDSGGLVPIQVA